ncbi:MAG: hypothetical protein D6830_05005 [Ignavibacteria bacterium]|nr:MAG: hypothetical protein D6830_05005 [Ignavibacteria bacterium]
MAEKKFNEPKTAFGRYMVYKFIPQYSNNVMGLVYVGAAILIIIVGMRGLGELVGQLGIFPQFMLNEAGTKISPTVVVLSLFLEFFLLLILAVVTFFTPEDAHHGGGHGEAEPAAKVALPDFKAEIEKIKELSNEEKVMVRSFLDEFEQITQKVNRIQESNIEALKKMREALSNN